MSPKIKNPSFGLISCTESPLETLFAGWVQSRPSQYPRIFEYMEENGYGDIVTADIIYCAILDEVVTEEDVKSVFKNVSAMSIPVSESIHFTWGFTSMPIEWREQAVRKRQWGFWLTSMREFGMDDFVDAGRYAPPVEGSVPDNGGLEFFHDFMKEIQNAYNKLKHEYEWPQEIARKLIPSCATHDGTMFSSFRTLVETLESRSCWIAQLDLWAPVLTGIVNSLKDKHPLLGLIVSPPCFDRYSDEYKGCAYKLINENRLTGKDPYAPCPIYCHHDVNLHRESSSDNLHDWLDVMNRAGTKPSYFTQGQRLLPIWSDIWNRDPFTGKLKG